jgi:hypothetical protein
MRSFRSRLLGCPGDPVSVRSLDQALLRGGPEDQRRALEWADGRAPSGRAKAKLSVSERQDKPQFPLHPYICRHIALEL